jgi:hypothetical protein
LEIHTMLVPHINLTFAQWLFKNIHKDYTHQTWQIQLNPYPNTIGHSTMIRSTAYYESDTVDNHDVDVCVGGTPIPILHIQPIAMKHFFSYSFLDRTV